MEFFYDKYRMLKRFLLTKYKSGIKKEMQRMPRSRTKIIHICFKRICTYANYFKSDESFFSLLLLFDFKDDEESSGSTFGDDGLMFDTLLLLVSGKVQEDSLLFSSK